MTETTSTDITDGWCTLTAPSDLKVLPLVRRTVEAMCDLGGLAPGRTSEIVLAVHEACTNIIRHAHGCQAHLPITVAVRSAEGLFEVRVKDCGEPFDFDAVPDLDPAEIREGGRGVFLIRRLMDEVSCAPCDGGGNEMRMLKRVTT